MPDLLATFEFLATPGKGYPPRAHRITVTRARAQETMTTRGSRATEDELAAFPLRYEVGDEVEVGLDGRSSLYPYDQGWGEGTIIKVHPLVSEFPKGAFRGMDASRLGAAVPYICLLYTSPSPRDATLSRMPSSA